MLKPLDLLAGRSSEATLRAHVSFLPHHRAGALLPENTGDSSPHFLVVFQLRAAPYSLESIEYPDSGKSRKLETRNWKLVSQERRARPSKPNQAKRFDINRIQG